MFCDGVSIVAVCSLWLRELTWKGRRSNDPGTCSLKEMTDPLSRQWQWKLLLNVVFLARGLPLAPDPQPVIWNLKTMKSFFKTEQFIPGNGKGIKINIKPIFINVFLGMPGILYRGH